jgi:hypothetical protein
LKEAAELLDQSKPFKTITSQKSVADNAGDRSLVHYPLNRLEFDLNLTRE